MKPLAVRVLFEHGPDGHPFGSSCIRFLRPLTHPFLRDVVALEAGTDLGNQPVDAVIIDRRWRIDINVESAQALVQKIRNTGARLIYAIDDSFFDLPPESKDWAPTSSVLGAVECFLRHADGAVVTTPALKERLASYTKRIVVVPNMLDERLLSTRRLIPSLEVDSARDSDRPITIGYMGTFTHDDDLRMIVPALRAVCERYAGRIAIEFIGVMAKRETADALKGLPWQVILPATTQYAGFMHWFSARIAWDIALAPLQDIPFNRSKSDIKFLDYAAISAAGIYSNMPSYADSVQQRQTGMLVDNTTDAWEAALDELVCDADLRRNIGQNAIHYLYRERIVARMRRKWLAAFAELLN